MAGSAWRLAAPVTLALAGLLLTAGAASARGSDLRPDRRTDLADLVRAQQVRAERTVGQVDQLRQQVDRLTRDQGRQDSRVAAARAGGERLATAAGLTAVTGPGVSVTLTDAPRTIGSALPAGVSPDDLVVHQQDLQAVVNALWAGGAEAVQLMDQRVISTSAVRCVGNTLILQGRVYSPPFTVRAVGDPARLRAALAASPDVQAYLGWSREVGLGYDEREARRLALPAFAGPLALRHARAASA